MSKKVILKFEECAEQVSGPVRRVVGFVSGRSMVPLLDVVDLSANPRSAKAGSVTSEIIESLSKTPELFSFKSKGILIGASAYRSLERHRYELIFEEPDIEGILDGGHNSFAIGCYILQIAGISSKELKAIRTWDNLKKIWSDSRDMIDQVKSELDFIVPVEILLPADMMDMDSVEQFTSSLLDICAARNNNVQLTEETKAAKRGFYDEVRRLLPENISAKVEWKANDGGEIKAREIIALSWIPLSVLDLPSGIRVNPNQIYRNKAVCVETINRLMEHPDVSEPVDGGYVHELNNHFVESAFELVGVLPLLFDQLYTDMPDAYNRAGGHFGRIGAVKMFDPAKVREKNPKYLKRQPTTPFLGKPVNYTCPEGFLIPLLYGVRALIGLKDGRTFWKVDPAMFLRNNLVEIMKSYKLAIEMAGFDPQKVGKNISAYEFAEAAIRAQAARQKLAA